ncbi:MAG TPA: YdeI/OmpD-associated family protein [Tepidisphaeraceae bacterium]
MPTNTAPKPSRKSPPSKSPTKLPHTLPDDMRAALHASPKALAAWEDITPLARNEWICWTVSVKKPETRKEHVRRLVEDLIQGKRRPCCWPGCPHR